MYLEGQKTKWPPICVMKVLFNQTLASVSNLRSESNPFCLCLHLLTYLLFGLWWLSGFFHIYFIYWSLVLGAYRFIIAVSFAEWVYLYIVILSLPQLLLLSPQPTSLSITVFWLEVGFIYLWLFYLSFGFHLPGIFPPSLHLAFMCVLIATSHLGAGEMLPQG